MRPPKSLLHASGLVAVCLLTTFAISANPRTTAIGLPSPLQPSDPPIRICFLLYQPTLLVSQPSALQQRQPDSRSPVRCLPSPLFSSHLPCQQLLDLRR